MEVCCGQNRPDVLKKQESCRMSKGRVRGIGLVGTAIAGVQAEAIASLDHQTGCRLYARDARRAKEFAAQYGVTPDRLPEVSRPSELDLVSVCTPAALTLTLESKPLPQGVTFWSRNRSKSIWLEPTP
jgi:hypothetical protein